MSTYKPMPSPMATVPPLSKMDGLPMFDPEQYRSVIGALKYATLTRQDIAFSINCLCQFMLCPHDTHYKEVKRLRRYIKDILDLGLFFVPFPNLTLSVFLDADG